MLSSAFWADPRIPQKSYGHFHFNPLLISNSRYCGVLQLQVFDPVVINPNPQQALPGPLGPGESEMLQFWLERHQDWENRRRSWYATEKQLWDATPWAFYVIRRAVPEFARCFAIKDEIQCRQIATSLTDLVSWKTTRNDYIMTLPPHSPRGYLWAYHTLGLLMFAALPIRHKPVSDKSRYPATTTNYTPSQTASTASSTSSSTSIFSTPVKVHHSARRKRDFSVPANVFHDTLTRESEGSIANFNHENYLDLISNVLLQMGATGAVIEYTWMREIVRVATEVRSQRRDVRRRSHLSNSWGQWTFWIPVYDGVMARYLNGLWVPVVRRMVA